MFLDLFLFNCPCSSQIQQSQTHSSVEFKHQQFSVNTGLNIFSAHLLQIGCFNFIYIYMQASKGVADKRAYIGAFLIFY